MAKKIGVTVGMFDFKDVFSCEEVENADKKIKDYANKIKSKDFSPLEKTIYKVDFSDKNCLAKIKSNEINFALYQQMVGQNDEEHFRQIPAGYFDLIIVDECHGVAVSASTFTMYEKVLNHLAARHKYGLTATDHRADGLIKATFALIGKVAYEIPKEATADRVTAVKIRTVETDNDITDECLNTDGTINYTKLIEYLTTDEERNKLIARKVIEEKNRSCIILSDRLEQLETIRNLLPYEMQEKAVYINGRMTSKKAKAEREARLEQMRTGEKKYLFASYKIAREGLDIPCLERLFMASPVKDPAVVEQSVGRIRRTADGKTEIPVVYDIKDVNIGMCVGWYRKRCSVYRKIDAEIEK